MTPDDVARVALGSALEVDGVVRAGMAVTRGAGRELDFVASDTDTVGAVGVRWCHIDGVADVPLAQAVHAREPVFIASPDDLLVRFPHMAERQHSVGTRSMAALPLVRATCMSAACCSRSAASRSSSPTCRRSLRRSRRR